MFLPSSWYFGLVGKPRLVCVSPGACEKLLCESYHKLLDYTAISDAVNHSSGLVDL